MKKTLSAVMTASLLLANSCALPVFAEGEPSFSVSNAKGKAGEPYRSISQTTPELSPASLRQNMILRHLR